MTAVLVIRLVGCLALGLAVGALYFAAMWRSAQLFAGGGRTMAAVTLVVGRFAAIVLVLGGVATRGGAGPLLATALGIVVARWVAVRRVRALAP